MRIDDELLELGRHAFYAETFSNEYFLNDVLGVLNGPITHEAMARALLRLRGRGTNNLRAQLQEDITIGDRTFREGEYMDTGIDVPRGVLTPMGFNIRYERGNARVGVTCAVCHSTVDDRGNVLEGVPNPNLNMGLLLAMASNSAAAGRSFPPPTASTAIAATPSPTTGSCPPPKSGPSQHWVDEEASVTREDQDALIHYLLLLGHHPEARPPEPGGEEANATAAD